MSGKEAGSSLRKIPHLGQITRFSTRANSFLTEPDSGEAPGMNLAIIWIGERYDFGESHAFGERYDFLTKREVT